MNGLLSILYGIVVGVAVTGGTIFFTRWLDRRRSQPTPQPQPEGTTLTGLSEEEARAVDPDNLPYYSRYRIHGYDEAQAPSCSCHGRKVKPGERILIWPIPGHPDGGADVFCAETFEQVGR